MTILELFQLVESNDDSIGGLTDLSTIHDLEGVGGSLFGGKADESKLFADPRRLVLHHSSRDDRSELFEGVEEIAGFDVETQAFDEEITRIDRSLDRDRWRIGRIWTGVSGGLRGEGRGRPPGGGRRGRGRVWVERMEWRLSGRGGPLGDVGVMRRIGIGRGMMDGSGDDGWIG